MHYRLTCQYVIHGITVVEGSIFSTEAPVGSLFRLEPQEAEKMEAEGILAPYTPPAEPACLTERGWTRMDVPAWDRARET